MLGGYTISKPKGPKFETEWQAGVLCEEQRSSQTKVSGWALTKTWLIMLRVSTPCTHTSMVQYSQHFGKTISRMRHFLYRGVCHLQVRLLQSKCPFNFFYPPFSVSHSLSPSLRQSWAKILHIKYLKYKIIFKKYFKYQNTKYFLLGISNTK